MILTLSCTLSLMFSILVLLPNAYKDADASILGAHLCLARASVSY